MKTLIAALTIIAVLALGACGKHSETQWLGFVEDGVLVIENCITDETDLVVPEEIAGYPVGKLDANAFYGVKCKSIALPDTVTYIDEYAFRGCESLEQIELGKGVKSIGMGAFSGCLVLKSVTFPEGMETIENPPFINNNELEEVLIPASVINLPERLASNKTCPKIVIVTPAGSEAEKVALAQGLTVRNPETNVSSTVTELVSGQLISDSIGCTDAEAESIASRLEKLGITEAVSVTLEETDGANRVLTVTAGDGKAYEVGIDKLNRVYAIIDKKTGEYLFSITE